MRRNSNPVVTKHYLERVTEGTAAKGYPKQKWVEFCETLLQKGFELRLYSSKSTVCKLAKEVRQQTEENITA